MHLGVRKTARDSSCLHIQFRVRLLNKVVNDLICYHFFGETLFFVHVCVCTYIFGIDGKATYFIWSFS
jgi:hypothetical protein